MEICIDCHYAANGYDWDQDEFSVPPLTKILPDHYLAYMGDESGESFFSNQECDACDQRLAGDRWTYDEKPIIYKEKAMLTKDEMLEQYDVIGFSYNYCVVTRKSDGVKGTLDFSATDSGSRVYFNFMEA